jgi:hypothetical protein
VELVWVILCFDALGLVLVQEKPEQWTVLTEILIQMAISHTDFTVVKKNTNAEPIIQSHLNITSLTISKL